MAFEENHYAPPTTTNVPTTNWGVAVVVFFIAGFQILTAMLVLLILAVDSSPAMTSVLGSIAVMLLGLLGIWSICSMTWRQFAARGHIFAALFWGYGLAKDVLYFTRNPHELSNGLYVSIGIVVVIVVVCVINSVAIGRLNPPVISEEAADSDRENREETSEDDAGDETD